MSRIAAAAGKVAVMAAAHNPHFKNRLRLNIKKSASCGFSLSVISPLSLLGRGVARHADSFPAQRLNLLPVYSIGQQPRRREPPYRLERRRRAQTYPVLAERVVRSRRHFAAYDLALARHFFLDRFRQSQMRFFSSTTI